MNYQCPVCQKLVSSVSELAACVNYHSHCEEIKAAKRKEEEIRRKREEENKKIKDLKSSNEKLFEKLKQNCAELNKLGVGTVAEYKVNNFREGLKSDTTEDYLDHLFKTFKIFD